MVVKTANPGVSAKGPVAERWSSLSCFKNALSPRSTRGRKNLLVRSVLSLLPTLPPSQKRGTDQLWQLTALSQNAVSSAGTDHVCLSDRRSAGSSVMLHVLSDYFQSQTETVLSCLSSVFRGSCEELNHFHLKAFCNSTLLRAETCPLRCKPSRQVTENRARGVGSMNRPPFLLWPPHKAPGHTPWEVEAQGGRSADWNSPWHLKRECV